MEIQWIIQEKLNDGDLINKHKHKREILVNNDFYKFIYIKNGNT